MISASDNCVLLQWGFCQINLLFDWKLLSDFIFLKNSATVLSDEQVEQATLKISSSNSDKKPQK